MASQTTKMSSKYSKGITSHDFLEDGASHNQIDESTSIHRIKGFSNGVSIVEDKSANFDRERCNNINFNDGESKALT